MRFAAKVPAEGGTLAESKNAASSGGDFSGHFELAGAAGLRQVDQNAAVSPDGHALPDFTG